LAILSSTILDIVIRNLHVRGNIPNRLKQICAHADDIVITGRTTQVLTDTFFKLKREALKAGLIININKPKYLYCTRKSNQLKYLISGCERFEQLNSINYLGTTVNTENSIEQEINEGIAAGNRTYHVH
jgi:hypothetical protein